MRPRARGTAAWAVGVLLVAGCSGTPVVAPTASPVSPTAAATPQPSASASPATASATPSGWSAEPTCNEVAASLGPAEQAGQLVMVGVTGSLDAAERKAIDDAALGSVILMGSSTEGVAGTRTRTDALVTLGGSTGILVAVDQEGGQVQRLKGPGFDTIPSAAEQARLPLAELRARATGWGGQLAEAGVHLTFAPVADVVPADKVATNEPIGRLGRGYGTTPDAVAPRVAAVVAGLRAGGVGTSAKHFPNLGQVVGNTDFRAGVVDRVTTADDPALEPYRAAIAEGTDTVMMSTATFTKIDPDALAAFSPKVVGILRGALDFDGVVVSDDLGVAEAVADVPARQRAVRFVRAGGDLAISVSSREAVAMAAGLVEEARRDATLRARITESAGRVLELKARRGVLTCGTSSP